MAGVLALAVVIADLGEPRPADRRVPARRRGSPHPHQRDQPLPGPSPGPDPTNLTDPARFPTPATLQNALFDQLIPTLIDTLQPEKGLAEPLRPRRRHDPGDTRHWLG
ncbi:hypothetical protein GCM10009546_37230 [Actinomadura livida]|uniref:Uncharacterized protein n=1 Tax=Actinomadura livida TaxID=79909 RepID=A0ABN1EP93_9ACTN|nr:hypothetical protein GCM10010208_46960 [Actinomadura livida]